MFADVEVISNNTYGYNQFTYSIPHKFKTKLSIGSFVKVEFRNKIVDALVVNLKSKTEIKNPKNSLKVSNFTLDNEQDLYCKYIALSNRLNCGILLHNIIDLDNLRKQNILKTKSVSNINFQEFNNLFTKDAHIDYTAVGGIAGNLQEIIKYLETALDPFPNYQHLISNISLTLNGNSASGKVMCFNPMQTEDDQVFFLGMWYQDTYKKIDDKWFIASRVEESSWAHNVPSFINTKPQK